MALKASDVVAKNIRQYSEILPENFHALEYGHVGEDTYETLYAFETSRERYLWVASASNVDRWNVTHSEAVTWWLNV